jgi:hypothetical protein
MKRKLSALSEYFENSVLFGSDVVFSGFWREVEVFFFCQKNPRHSNELGNKLPQ